LVRGGVDAEEADENDEGDEERVDDRSVAQDRDEEADEQDELCKVGDGPISMAPESEFVGAKGLIEECEMRCRCESDMAVGNCRAGG
jgi:hypothetical protein